ncbi:MAG: hypothetical protein M1570_16610 [Chloroflexi bacterium]|nr:hypothetical protein [Chloroflexota bacterium]
MSSKLTWPGRLVIALVALVTYQPGLKIGHEGGWWYMEWAAKLPFWNYLVQYFDPGHVTQGYRPMQGIMVLAEYTLFRVNADGYHLAQIGMHIVTCWLLLAIVWELSRNIRLAFLSSLFFAGLPAYHLAIFRAPAVVDPWAAMFYLGTIWLWTHYLQTGRRVHYVLTLVVFVLALLSKEVSVFLPVLLFLIEWWFVRRQLRLDLALREYPLFFVAMVPYLLLELNVQSHGEFASQFGYKVGVQFLFNLLPYMAALTFPWYLDNFVAPQWSSQIGLLLYLWLGVAGIVLALAALKRRSLVILFLAIFAVLNISPLLGFPQEWFQARYLYIPYMAVAVLLALFVEFLWSSFRRRGWRYASASLAMALALVVLVDGQGVSVKAAEWAEYTREVRVPFHDISLAHPTFPNDTYLYFAYSPFSSVWDLEGLFFVRYGTGIKVDGTDDGHPSELQAHNAAYVYYFDKTGKPIEVPVEKGAHASSSTPLPARYEIPLTFEGYEIPSTTILRGKAFVIILDWMPSDRIPRDYQLFVHLVDAKGQTLAGYDGPPRRGKLPTSTWVPHNLVVDTVVLPVNANTPIGDDYHVEIGLYDLQTMRRVSIVDSAGRPTADSITLFPFSVR